MRKELAYLRILATRLKQSTDWVGDVFLQCLRRGEPQNKSELSSSPGSTIFKHVIFLKVTPHLWMQLKACAWNMADFSQASQATVLTLKTFSDITHPGKRPWALHSNSPETKVPSAHCLLAVWGTWHPGLQRFRSDRPSPHFIACHVWLPTAHLHKTPKAGEPASQVSLACDKGACCNDKNILLKTEFPSHTSSFPHSPSRSVADHWNTSRVRFQ